MLLRGEYLFFFSKISECLQSVKELVFEMEHFGRNPSWKHILSVINCMQNILFNPHPPQINSYVVKCSSSPHWPKLASLAQNIPAYKVFSIMHFFLAVKGIPCKVYSNYYQKATCICQTGIMSSISGFSNLTEMCYIPL